MSATVRHDWTLDEVRALFAQPFNDLLHCAGFDFNNFGAGRVLTQGGGDDNFKRHGQLL